MLDDLITYLQKMREFHGNLPVYVGNVFEDARPLKGLVACSNVARYNSETSTWILYDDSDDISKIFLFSNDPVESVENEMKRSENTSACFTSFIGFGDDNQYEIDLPPKS